MLLVSDVSLNELECKHALNNSAKTELISRCLRLSRETPDLMLYRWIRCSDLIIYITFLYMKKKENLALILYSVLIPLRSCGSVRKSGWSSLVRGAPSTPLPSQCAFVERRRGCDSTSFHFAHNNVPPQCGESTHYPCSRRRPWLLSESWDGPLVWAGSLTAGVSSVPLELQSCVDDGCRRECWTGRWHWGSLEWPMDTSIFYGRKDSDWRKIHPENGTAYPLKWEELVTGVYQPEAGTQLWGLGSELQPLTWEAEMRGMPLNFWLARLEPTLGQDEFSFG